MTPPFRIAITSGDADGIGFEIVAKALNKLGPVRGVQFYLWRPTQVQKKYLKLVQSRFDCLEVGSWPDALRLRPESHKTLVDIRSNLSPAHWVEEAATAANFGHLDAIATAPLSKGAIRQAGLRDIGHTDILKRVAHTERVAMAFSGRHFNVVLATAHHPLGRVAQQVTRDRVRSAIELASEFRRALPSKVARRPICVLGLNPHAGEERLLGAEEQDVHIPLIAEMQAEGFEIDGPAVPDVAFLKENWDRYSVFVAMYHDQGLIPFKMAHGREGVHITLGLPFVRTSVDHGTAKDIFGKDKADSRSMLAALTWAVEQVRKIKKSRGER